MPAHEGTAPVAGGEDKLRLLVEASSRLLASLSLAEVLSSILDVSGLILPADAYSIWRQKDGIWQAMIAKGLSDGYLRQTVSAGLGGIPADPMILDDLQTNAQLAARQELYQSEGIRALIAIPLTIRGALAGTLVFYSRRPHRFTEQEISFASALANLASAAITTAELHEDQRRLVAQAEAAGRKAAFLAEASRALASSLDYEATLSTVARLAVGYMADWCTVDITEVTAADFRRLAVAHIDPVKLAWAQQLRERYQSDPDSGAARVIRTGEPVLVSIIEDAQLVAAARDEEHLRLVRELGLTSYLCVPMRSRDTVLGALTFVRANSGSHYGDSDLAFAQDLANRCAIAIDNARLYTSLQKANNEISEAHERLSNVLESTKDAFFALDHDWRITHVNGQAASLARAAREDLIGRIIWDLFPQMRSRNFFEELQRAADILVPVQFEEYSAPSEVWLEVNAYPARFGVAVFARDITEKKKFEERLRQTAKLESLGVLAGGVAHDFNNILVGILGNASLALEALSPSSPLQERLQDVVTATERAANLTRQLLAYAGKGQFVIKPLDLSELLREISGLLQTSIPRSVQMRVDLAEHLPCVEGDATQMQQLFMNLVINAAEAVGEKTPGTVTVATRLQDVDADYIRHVLTPAEIQPGTYVCVEVTDTGCGMDPETISRIFDPFFTTKFTGRGLGLAAALGIVRAHRGTLKVYSTPGKGSTFKVLLPATTIEPPERTWEAPPTSLAGSGLILVIDDEEIVRRTAQITLERYGYQVIAAENGQEGLKLFEILAEKVALVLLDLTMPVMSGEETLRGLQTIRPDVRVVLSSGFNHVEAIQSFTGEGWAGFIQKPYTAAALAECIKAFIG